MCGRPEGAVGTTPPVRPRGPRVRPPLPKGSAPGAGTRVWESSGGTVVAAVFQPRLTEKLTVAPIDAETTFGDIHNLPLLTSPRLERDTLM